jgi:thymidylate synthase
MTPVSLFARDLSDAWFQCLYNIFDYGKTYTIDRGSFKGQQRLEFDHITVHIKYPCVRPLLPVIPPSLNIPNPVADDYLDNYMSYLMESEVAPNEEYTYGQYLKPQISKVIDMFKNDGYNTNQACMTVGDINSINQEDPACLKIIDCRISDNKLHFIVYFRSNELWAAMPANLASIQLLKEYMSSEIGVDDGEIIYSSKGLHLYDYSWELAKIRTGRT